MNRKQHKELWALRFGKLDGIEHNSVDRYEELLRECEKIPKPKEVRHAICYVLEQIIRDEHKHIKLAEQLRDILAKQSD